MGRNIEQGIPQPTILLDRYMETVLEHLAIRSELDQHNTVRPDEYSQPQTNIQAALRDMRISPETSSKEDLIEMKQADKLAKFSDAIARAAVADRLRQITGIEEYYSWLSEWQAICLRQEETLSRLGSIALQLSGIEVEVTALEGARRHINLMRLIEPGGSRIGVNWSYVMPSSDSQPTSIVGAMAAPGSFDDWTTEQKPECMYLLLPNYGDKQPIASIGAAMVRVAGMKDGQPSPNVELRVAA